MKKRMKKITKSKQKHLAKTYKKHKKHLAKTYKKHKKYLRKTYKKHKFFLQKGGMVADPPDLPDDNCSICFSSMADTPTRTTPCDHTFHARCLQEWLLRSNTCPFCRAPVNPEAPNIMIQAFQLCEEGNLNMLQTLLNEHPYDVNIIQTEYPHTGWTLLHEAAFNGNMGIVNMLITRGVYSNARTPTMQLASDIAREQGHDEVAVFIEQAIARAAADSAAARAQMMSDELELARRRPADSIRRAVRFIVHLEFMRVSVMLESGIINATARIEFHGDNLTLLHLAAYRGHMRLVQELLLRGASARAVSLSRRETPAQLVRRVSSDRFREIAPYLEAVERAEVDAEAAAEAARAELEMAANTPTSSAYNDEDDL